MEDWKTGREEKGTDAVTSYSDATLAHLYERREIAEEFGERGRGGELEREVGYEYCKYKHPSEHVDAFDAEFVAETDCEKSWRCRRPGRGGGGEADARIIPRGGALEKHKKSMKACTHASSRHCASRTMENMDPNQKCNFNMVDTRRVMGMPMLKPDVR
jgi:hypothetical protein